MQTALFPPYPGDKRKRKRKPHCFPNMRSFPVTTRSGFRTCVSRPFSASLVPSFFPMSLGCRSWFCKFTGQEARKRREKNLLGLES
ncbi:unnamed protein product [Periconia digitata]|uniref:Uncharacterized protein n=1 Tax=Periconia digitata TaxID=1303443 RepID=A0A9W4XMH8_9PLEO|nr:unnamed protein product [Periconia digitata]